jgi:capsular polysaccharide biosynthesis protein
MTTETIVTPQLAEGRYRLAASLFPAPERSRKWTPVAWSNYWRSYRNVHRLFRAGSILEGIAEKSWEISPGSTAISRAAFFLPGQLERVTGMAYTEDPRRDMQGGIETFHPPVRGFLVKDAILLDGSLYKANQRLDLHSRARIPRRLRYIPRMQVEYELDCGAIYSSYDGNEFFGLWLTDDCPNYILAKDQGIPITSNQPASPHMLQYEKEFGMTPLRANSAFLRTVALFDDCWGNNFSKHARFRLLKEKLLSNVKVKQHPGVFILRRDSGKPRIMHNEIELAEYLRERRGFRIVDVTKDDVPTIVANCAGARIIAGIEGSHLVHGLMALQPGGAVLTLHPSYRFCSVIKRTTDMEDLRFGFVVGHAEAGGFRADPVEVERTLDLFPPLPACIA